MNDKCCLNCSNAGTVCCPIIKTAHGWSSLTHSCSDFKPIPLPDKPGKIEPLSMLVSEGKMVEAVTTIGIKVNELIAAHNGRDGR